MTKTSFTNLIYGISKQYIKMAIGKSRELFDKDLIVCKERGNIFCAVLQKS
jgi:hypothetical protein